METKPRLIDRFWFRAALVFAALLPVLLLRDLTPDNEMKYLTIADESLRDGHFWCMYLNGEAYADKPPLYIWILMLFKQLFGRHCIFVLELFSLIPALVTIRTLERWSSAEDGLNGRWLLAAELSLMTSAYFLGGSIVLRMDMLMTMFITLALWTFWRIDKGDGSLRLKILFPLYVFMAIFSKGPVGIMIPLLCIPVWLASQRRIKDFGKVWEWRTWLILIALCAIWWIFVYLEGGSEYLNNLLFHQTAGRAVNAFHHKQPVYYYCYTILYAMGPWSLISLSVIIGCLVKRVQMSALTRFHLIISGTFFVIMSLVSGKLAIYLLPIFGPLTFAAAQLLQQLAESERSPRLAATLREILIWGSLAMLAACLVIGLFFPAWLNGLL